MSKRKKLRTILLSLLIIGLFFNPVFWAQEECTEYTETVTENFDTDLYKNTEYSSVAYWPIGPITLNWLGGQLEVSEANAMGAKIYVCDTGDFDGDGDPDLIALDIGPGGNQHIQNRLLLVRNWWEDMNLDGLDDDGIILFMDPTEVYEEGIFGCVSSISVADYNNDGLLDFFFLKNRNDDHVYEDYAVAMYINVGTATDPDFYPFGTSPNLDFTSMFQNANIYGYRWTARHSCAVDIDKDGDSDVLIIDDDKIYLLRNPGPGNFDVAHFTISELNYDQQPGFPIALAEDYGGSTVAAADFDSDGDYDIITGTVEDVPFIVYYDNDGTGNFTRSEIPIPNPVCTGPTTTMVGDFNNDGRLDFFCATDVHQSGNDARSWIMENYGLIEGGGCPIDFRFRCLNDCLPVTPDPYDTDFGTVLDYDMDGDLDIIVADANDSGDYYLIINLLANVYTTYGEARSLNLIPLLDTLSFAVTKVTISSIRMGTRGKDKTGLKVEFYLSNNGEDWELFQTWEGSQIRNYNNLPTHTFKHFGSQLLWKAVFSAPEDPMEDYTGASFDTPIIDEIEFEYVHVDRREYSRTSVAATVTDELAVQRKLIIGSTFYYPSFYGHLRAYDVSSVTAQDTAYSVLRTITRPNASEPSGREIVQEGVEIFWDAGILLRDCDASTRNIFTAVKSGSDYNRVEFTAANVAVLGPILQDVNNDNEGLINFIRGQDREWKLGDSNHSNPIVVGPPMEAPQKMKNDYQTFMNYWADRKKVLYLGANDGMLHCFDALTGEELWAFIPYNLLPRLKDMWQVFPTTGERYYEHHIYVDGSPVAADVFIDANGDNKKEWRTILICGQGSGNGSSLAGGLNYYFALDVTDPENPQPLWEFTHAKLGETWSRPAVGRIKKQSEVTWVVFVGSGYDNSASAVVGNRFYVVYAETGETFWGFDVAEVDTTAALGWNIPNALPASPAVVDLNQDGLADRVYIPDLDGRMWKVNVSLNWVNATSWAATAIYTDSNNFPIVCEPAIWINPISAEIVPRLYFGTGGDDRAPGDVNYSFISLIDGTVPEVEWYLGDPLVVDLPMEKDMGDIAVGEKVWADPKVADFIVYFSTLIGSIDSVDPCESLAGIGKLYARFIQAEAGSLIGGTALQTFTGPVEFLELSIKTRAAVTLGERQRTGEGTRKREVYIQEYDSTIQKLEQFAIALLKVKSWREIFKIIR
jgi:hypothetical protein